MISRLRTHGQRHDGAWSLKVSLIVIGAICFAACSQESPEPAEQAAAVATTDAKYRQLDPIDVWPGVAPGSENWKYEEIWEESGNTVRNVVRPTLTPFLPDPENATGTAVIVAPGGAFLGLAMAHEGYEPAKWLAERGVAAFVLKYRTVETPKSRLAFFLKAGDLMKGISSGDAGDDNTIGARALLAAADAEKALEVVRSRANEWGYSPKRVGLMGFSAGGFVTTHVLFNADAASRPDFAAPIYGGLIDPKLEVPKELPPVFAVGAADDPLAAGLVDMAHRLLTAGHKPALHFYASGGHGFGLKKQGKAVDHWIDEFQWWMQDNGFLNKDR